MMKDKDVSLQRLARKIAGLKKCTRFHVRVDAITRRRQHDGRWQLIKDWAAECWIELNEVKMRFHPRRLVRRLQRSLRRVDGILRKNLVFRADVPDVKTSKQVSRTAEELSLFAKLMAAPRGEGQLLC